ncbi:hypothetical protein BABINDRAFT_163764 [Babjeviella inositovora NRRL Y-12698]|uniref:Uncharacterized protein n=1 Tax=Babjeviella inositovora NRRL Y-12698 TaxID=984486 RepID=A0A1E3QHU6_9ASCO|nr:uncharacterized protein BABINDRAFT_163764 [Babjeviella inositovora NRRL Y-12698]ODQ77269.1 hypothetical protein BABINDRAFT_163764 [Babjeviella inositovora NRRL Y-12698]
MEIKGVPKVDEVSQKIRSIQYDGLSNMPYTQVKRADKANLTKSGAISINTLMI